MIDFHRNRNDFFYFPRCHVNDITLVKIGGVISFTSLVRLGFIKITSVTIVEFVLYR